MFDVSDEELRNLQPDIREEYWRNRFRSYMNRFQIYKADDTKFEMDLEYKQDKIYALLK